MSQHQAHRAALILVALLLLLAAPGCASLRRVIANSDDISIQQKQRQEESVKMFETRRNQAQLQAAQSRWREGNLPACREALDQVLKRNPGDPAARLLLAEVLLSEENYERAATLLEGMLKEHPDDAQLHFLSGLAAEGLGHVVEAKRSYQRAAEIDPLNEDFPLYCQSVVVSDLGGVKLASHLSKQGDVPMATASDAGEAFDDSPELARVFGDAQRALAAGELSSARMQLLRAADIEPGNPRAAIRAAVLALRYGQPDLAVSLLQPRAARFADSAAFFRTLGTAYFQQADYKAAKQALETAVSLDNTHALAYFLMGCTLEKLGQTSAAAAQYELARKLGSQP